MQYLSISTLFESLMLAALLLFSKASVFASQPSWTECLDISEDKVRLDCYDDKARATRQLNTHNTPIPEFNNENHSGEKTADVITPTAFDDQFGKKLQPVNVPIQSIEAQIVSVSNSSTGRQIIELSNNQVWTENEPGKRKLKPGEIVTIALDGKHYDLKRPSNPDIPVSRIR
ncbi:MAG: hypothetical protein OEZ23_06140 [Gammaproteobacteria bacterium]|nr:hypothetical protein [Gammaproteobacteria bacterium]